MFTPGAEETLTVSLIQIAFTDQDLSTGQMAIKDYRNGTLIGSYTTGNPSSWPTGDAGVFFGARTGTGTTTNGAMDALIEGGRIDDTVLTPSELQAVKPVPGPLPVLGMLVGFPASRLPRQRIRATRGIVRKGVCPVLPHSRKRQGQAGADPTA